MAERARRMRREKTSAERKLWRLLRELNRRGLQFRQQAPIGPYIADFAEHSAKLVLEVDGGQHGEEAIARSDGERTRWLELQGYQVIRFWNDDVLRNTQGVMTAVLASLGILQDRDEPCSASSQERDPIPSTLVGEGQGGGESLKPAVGSPPTPNPSPQGGGGRRVEVGPGNPQSGRWESPPPLTRPRGGKGEGDGAARANPAHRGACHDR